MADRIVCHGISGSCEAAMAWLGTWPQSGAVSLDPRHLGC